MAAPFIGPFIAPGPAAGADVEPAQAEVIADLFRVVVFDARDRMTAPADDRIRPHVRHQHARLLQDVEHRIGDAFARVQIEPAVVLDLGADVDQIAQHREQVLPDAFDHAAVDERARRCMLDVEYQTARALDDLDAEVVIGVEQRGGIVGVVAGVQHGERAAAEQFENARVGGCCAVVAPRAATTTPVCRAA
jgi:hypothetical protein